MLTINRASQSFIRVSHACRTPGRAGPHGAAPDCTPPDTSRAHVTAEETAGWAAGHVTVDLTIPRISFVIRVTSTDPAHPVLMYSLSKITLYPTSNYLTLFQVKQVVRNIKILLHASTNPSQCSLEKHFINYFLFWTTLHCTKNQPRFDASFREKISWKIELNVFYVVYLMFMFKLTLILDLLNLVTCMKLDHLYSKNKSKDHTYVFHISLLHLMKWRCLAAREYFHIVKSVVWSSQIKQYE